MFCENIDTVDKQENLKASGHIVTEIIETLTRVMAFLVNPVNSNQVYKVKPVLEPRG